jgi:CHAD domain-containing protein
VVTFPDDATERARGYLAAQAVRLRVLGPTAAQGDDDAVHDARTATRRLRTELALCAARPDVDGLLRAALGDLGRGLGAVRDPAVQLAWLGAALDSHPGDGELARGRFEADRLAAREAALVELRRVLGSPAQARLLDGLDEVVAREWDLSAERLRHRVAREWSRLDCALAAADEASPDERDTALHAARRRARRARYACEVVGGEAASHRAALAEAVQDALGAQHDAVLARSLIADVAAAARAAGEDPSPYDWLDDLAADAADRAVRASERATDRARATGHRRWLG